LSNAKKIAHVIRYELQHLIGRRINALLLAGYALLALAISYIDSFREMYFGVFDSVALELTNFILPIFLFVNFVLVLSPVFAGEIENHIEEIPSTCVYGRRTRCMCKLLAALLFVILLNVAYHLITCIIGLVTQPLEAWNQLVASVGGENVFSFLWSARSHYLFAVFSLILGSIVAAVSTLLISCNSKATMTVCAWMSFIGILEFMLNRFSFWDVLQQYNLWQLFTPYRLASDAPFYYPAANVAVIGGFFVVICTVLVWRILKKGI
jgi:hypothetical protein